MGAVASRCADRVVITSDNPRGESPEVIIREIVEGVDPTSSATIVTIADRRAAICDAIATAEAGDVIVIAGKGHETTQEFADRTIELDDRAVARDCLEAHG
jgi:UDP-N-acetylmuramoyl-L-alanyl-D-glutamate--2,6-diaminopimelate ligase